VPTRRSPVVLQVTYVLRYLSKKYEMASTEVCGVSLRAIAWCGVRQVALSWGWGDSVSVVAAPDERYCACLFLLARVQGRAPLELLILATFPILVELFKALLPYVTTALGPHRARRCPALYVVA
jgi:hypothetical protein